MGSRDKTEKQFLIFCLKRSIITQCSLSNFNFPSSSHCSVSKMGSESVSEDSRDTCLPTSSYVWSPASESALFQALIKHKPAGINKHFAMALVSEKLCSQLSTEQISS